MSDIRRQQSEHGVVALFMTLVMMIVITLLVLGFAEIARNEQRSSLDDQLSTQAYYAAESGINDVRAVMNADVASGTTVPDKTVCGSQGPYTVSGVVDASHNVAATCVTVDAAPTTLSYSVGYTSTVVPLVSSGPAFGGLTLSWKVGAGYASTPAGCYTNLASLGNYPVASGPGQWGCNYPLLRADILDAGGGLSRASWTANTSTMFFVPFDSVSVGNSTGLGSHGGAIPARCDTSSCQVSLTGLSGSRYYLRLTTLYRTNASLSIISTTGQQFIGAQAIIDSTGKAQDVLRRIRVAVDLTDANAGHIPSAAIISQDSVCKRFGITNGSFNIYDDMSVGGGGNSLCSVQSVGNPIP